MAFLLSEWKVGIRSLIERSFVMKSRLIPGLLVTAGITVALLAVSAGRASAQCDGPCPVPVVTCPPVSEGVSTCVAPFSPAMDTWTYLFLPNNSIKVATDVSCPFLLQVDLRTITQSGYAARRKDPEFADTVCNPTGDDGNCVFYRLHGELVDRSCYATGPDAVHYTIFWNTPPIQGNKHDWMLLRARCSETPADVFPPPFGNACDNSQKFSENTTIFVDRKPPVGTDPAIGGGGDGISDFIVAISTRHPHMGIPPMPF